MSYPQWDNATSYPVGSIVWFNNLLYQATGYHDTASTLAPNVEMGTDPFNPIFLSQRSWTLYATLPTGYSPSQFAPDTNILIKQQDINDRYVFFGQYAPSPYGFGESSQLYAGSSNNPTTPCPADKCISMLATGSGFTYANTFNITKQLVNPVKPPGYTYYISGPYNPYPDPNTLYVWWEFNATYCFRRPVVLTCECDGVIQNQTFTPTDDNYTTMATPVEWYTPGNASATFSFVSGFGDVTYDIAPND
jgi:hypothetical protein